MILKLSRLIRARVHGDEGIAMIMVMGTIMVLTVLLALVTDRSPQGGSEASQARVLQP